MPAARLVGIAGPSCSGKTELARRLAERTGAPVLNLDVYYIDLAHLPLEERAATNFDDPESLDREAILEDARALARGLPIEAPLYDFATHTRRPGGRVVEPRGMAILEGLFTLHWPELRRLLDPKIYVDAPDEACFARRLERDVRERGRTPESVREQYKTMVRPMARLHILPGRQYADLVVSGTDPIEESVARVLARLGWR